MLVGRRSECARISEVVIGAREGRGAALVLRGEPGIGKSALLAYAREEAAGMQILATAGVESEVELPFASLMTVLAPLLPRLDRLPAVQRAALETALALRADGAPDRFTVALATLNLLTVASEDTPVLANVDDAHLLDTASAHTLLFVARRLGGERLAMLFAVREGERSSVDVGGLAEMRLGGLSVEDARELVGTARGHRISPSVLEYLTRASGGNPLALLELPSVVDPARLDDELLKPPLPVGPRIKAAFSRQLAALPPSAQRSLGLAALSDTGHTAEVVRMLKRLGSDASELTPAEVAGLVTVDAERIEFRHPLVRAVAYDSLPAPDRRIGHLALAEALRAQPDRARRAWHLAAAVVAPDEEIACELESAAHEAHDRGAPAAAAPALRAAARLTPSDDERVRRLIDAAREFHVAGRSQDASTALETALGHVTDPLLEADLEHLRARIGLLNESCLDTRARLVGQAARVEGIDPLRAAAMLVDASVVAVMTGEPREALTLARRAYPIARQAGGDIGLAADHVLGTGLLLCGEAQEAVPLLERADALTEADDLGGAGHLAVAAAQCHNWHDAHPRASDRLRRLVTRARAQSAMTVLPYALAALAEAEFHLGDWSSAYAAATESVSLAEEAGQRSELAHSLVRLAHVAAGRGEDAHAREHAARALELASRLDVGSIEILAGTALGFLELSLGRCDDAVAELEFTGRRAVARGLREPCVSMWASDLAEAYARQGRRADAETVLEGLEGQARPTGRCSALAAVARVRGMLADAGDYHQLFAQALHWHDGVRMPFELARTQLCFGERLRRSKRLVEGRDVLRPALATFEDLGAEPWAERARRELRAAGEQVRPHLTPVTGLTPQELQVALLVVDGVSNREAAAALFISPKTVEVHLTRIYRKLGVRSRTQLARALRASGEPERRRFTPEYERTRAVGR